MAREKRTLSLICDKFGVADALIIETAYREDVELRSLCEDYRVCVEALQRWKLSKSSEAPEREVEYEEMCSELEQDIYAMLQDACMNHKESTSNHE